MRDNNLFHSLKIRPVRNYLKTFISLLFMSEKFSTCVGIWIKNASMKYCRLKKNSILHVTCTLHTYNVSAQRISTRIPTLLHDGIFTNIRHFRDNDVAYIRFLITAARYTYTLFGSVLFA